MTVTLSITEAIIAVIAIVGTSSLVTVAALVLVSRIGDES